MRKVFLSLREKPPFGACYAPTKPLNPSCCVYKISRRAHVTLDGRNRCLGFYTFHGWHSATLLYRRATRRASCISFSVAARA